MQKENTSTTNRREPPYGAQASGYDFVFHNLPGHLVRRLHQRTASLLMEQFDAVESDLTPVQYSALAVIFTHPEVDQTTVADLIGYDRATVGGVIDRLEKKELIKRQASPTDRRVRLLSIQPSGVALLKRVAPGILRVQEEIMRPLTAREKKSFTRLLSKLVWSEDT